MSLRFYGYMESRMAGKHQILAIVSCLFVANSVSADDLRYLPDNCTSYLRVEFAKLRESALGKEVRRVLPDVETFYAERFKSDGLALENISRMTTGAKMAETSSAEVTTYRLLKPVTAMSIEKSRNSRPGARNLALEETKIGKVTVYTEYLGTAEAKVFGRAFCIPEECVVVCSRDRAGLEAILERNKAAAISPALHAAIQSIARDDAITILFDIIETPKKAVEPEKQMMNRGFPGLGDVIYGGKSLRATVAATDKLSITIESTQKTTELAVDAKKVAESAIEKAKKIFVAAPLPAAVTKAVGKGLDAVAISTRDARTEAKVQLAPELVLPLLEYYHRPIDPSKLIPR